MAATEHLAEALVLRDGAEILIRPLGPRDRAGLAALFSGLSSESRYRRFHVPKRELSDSELVFFTDVDHVGHEALAAIDPHDGSIVGVARYVQCDDRPRVAAAAFEVADEWQRKGIAAALAERLVDRARVNGFDRLTATTRWENLPARGLLRCLGFRGSASGVSGGEIEFELTLRSASPRRRAAGPDRNRRQRSGFITRALGPGAAMLIAAVLLALPASAAAARTIRVTNTHDSGPGSLRSALAKAHDGDTVLAPAGTYRLKSQLFINPSVTVIGAGSNKTILTAGDQTRVIDTTNSSATVTLERLAVTHGKAEAGGGIENIANLKLTHVAVTDNVAAGGQSANTGGGIVNSGLLEITHSEISDNRTATGTAQGQGAGIADGVGGGSINISNSSITGNVAQGNGAIGGAIFFEPNDPANGSSIAVTDSTISGNKTLGTNDAGGAIFYEPIVDNGSPQFPLTFDRVTFSGNESNGGSDHALGGAVFYGPISDTTASFPFALVNDTFVGNRAGNANADGLGGGLALEPVMDAGSAELSFTNLTIARNSAVDDGTGGGIFYDPLGTFSAAFVNTIIALNKAANGPDCSQNLPSAGHNIESHTGCGFSQGVGDMQNTDPKLGPLANNGGPTETLALLPGSPAIDAGSDMACPSVDQRGISRPQGPHCDIGAFERKP
ncbi:MAG TPA: GNAT family N-acetyltransferase [Solirubrobacteraceae bacterium]|nr:GNAT family N-acetyltransferase [Solirubrobacteraceae bacterium]